LICRLRGTHSVLAPLLQQFFEGVLFEKRINIFDPAIVPRLGEPDVREYVRATFVPLVREKTVTTETRSKAEDPGSLFDWKPFQVTASESRPVLVAQRTPFNLVPCNRSLEQGFVRFADTASDVVAFAKNAGPQCLRIDYLTFGSRLAFYTPDFFVKTKSGDYLLVETKGRKDADVPLKARAAVAWCESASNGQKWKYLYVPQAEFERAETDQIEQLARACNPSLRELIDDATKAQTQLALYTSETTDIDATISEFLPVVVFQKLPERFQRAVEQSVTLYRFLQNKKGQNFAPAFQPLLGSIDEAAKSLIMRRLLDLVPTKPVQQDDYFAPHLGNLPAKKKSQLLVGARNLKKTLVFRNGLWPMGLLAFCLDFGLNGEAGLGGIFNGLKDRFGKAGDDKLYEMVERINQFRNAYVAHAEKALTKPDEAQSGLRYWIAGMCKLSVG
jgi:type III restriction enzyme